MAKKSGALTEEQKSVFEMWLKDKWKTDSACPICTANNWISGDHFVTPILYEPGGGISIGGLSYPQVFIICSNCGHTHYFNAMMIPGLVKPPTVDDQGQNDG